MPWGLTPCCLNHAYIFRVAVRRIFGVVRGPVIGMKAMPGVRVDDMICDGLFAALSAACIMYPGFPP